MIRLVGVTVRRDGQALLDGVDLGVCAGELLLVEGRRGAGKSTLLRVAAGLVSPEAGQVWIGGRDVSALRRSSLPYVRRNIGYLPPDAALLPAATAVENVMLALAVRGVRPAAARAEAENALVELGAGALRGRHTEMLSAGERRLVAMARAIVGRPPLLILDEPTTALHPDDAAAVLGAMLAAVKNGAALLCASADLLLAHAVAQVGGRRVTLQDGRLDDALVPRRQPRLPEGEAAAAARAADGVPVCTLDYAPTMLAGDTDRVERRWALPTAAQRDPLAEDSARTPAVLPDDSVAIEVDHVAAAASEPLVIEVSLQDDPEDLERRLSSEGRMVR